MHVKKISDSDITKYNQLAIEYGTIFNTIDWLKIFGDKVQMYGLYDKGDNLIGGFYLYRQKRLGLSVYRNTPFSPTIGPFLKINAKNPVAIMALWKKVLAEMADTIDGLRYSIIAFALNKKLIDTQPFIWKKFKVIPGYTYLVDLGQSIDDIRKNMSTERRNDIKKATKDGVTVKHTDDLQIVKSLIVKTFTRQGMTTDEHYIDKILFEFANKDNSFAKIALKDDNPISALFCIYDNNTAYYLLGGYDSENSHHGAGPMVVWEGIRHAKELGLKQFDFEGSMAPQIERYFRGFGGQLTPYYRICKAKLPLEILLKFFKRELF